MIRACILSIIMITSVILVGLVSPLSIDQGVSAQNQPPEHTPPTENPITEATPVATETPLETETTDLIRQEPPRLSFDPETNWVNFMGGSRVAPLAMTTEDDAAVLTEQDITLRFLQAYGAEFGLTNIEDLSLIRETHAEGRTFERFQQSYQGVPVLGGEMIIQLDELKNVISVSGKISTDLELSVTPMIDATRATDIAMQAVAETYPEFTADSFGVEEAGLWIYDTMIFDRISAPKQALVWRVIITGSNLQPVREYILVDAGSSEIIRQFSMLDTSRNRMIYDCASGWFSNCQIYRTETRFYGDRYGNTVTDGENAFSYFSDTYDFYKSRFNRDSINGRGMAMKAYVRYGQDYENAYWDGKVMVFGEGFSTDDIIPHELTHGVTEYESGLLYIDQPGAINESLSDVFGEFVDMTNNSTNDVATRWRVGEETPSGAIRNMQDPTLFANPDRINSNYYYCGYSDNGGVHWNSGVGNKAAFLIVDGGTFNGQTISGIGVTKASQIYYDVQTKHLMSTSEYPDLANALIQATIDRYGENSAEHQAVNKAILATEMNQTPCVGRRGFMYPNSTVMYSPVGTINNLTPELKWRQQADATSYRVLVKDKQKRIVLDQWFENNKTVCPDACRFSLIQPLRYGEIYSWAVQTHNPVSDGPWPSTKTFRVEYPANSPSDINPFEPADGLSLNTAYPLFVWAPVPGTTSYILTIQKIVATTPPTISMYLKLDIKPSEKCKEGENCVTQTSKGLLPGEYQYSIVAKFGTNSSSNPVIKHFIVNPVPLQPMISLPTEGALLNSLTPTLAWDHQQFAERYQVIITGPIGKLERTYSLDNLLDCPDGVCSVTLPTLEGGKHVAIVQAISDVGKGKPSVKRNFAIVSPSSVFLMNPVSQSATNNNRPTLSWSTDPLATVYTLSVKGPTNFLKTYRPSDVCNGTVCEARTEISLKAGLYQWNVTAINKAGKTATQSWTFSVPTWDIVPKAPYLTSPEDKRILKRNEELVFTWNHPVNIEPDEYLFVITGTKYIRQFYLDSNTYCQTGACEFHVFDEHMQFGKFSWKVIALNHGIAGPWSVLRTFRLGLSAPEIINPIEDSIESRYQIETSWEELDDASSYSLQLLHEKYDGSYSGVYTKTYKAIDICRDDVCKVRLPQGLSPHHYRLLIKGGHSTGFGLPVQLDFTYEPFSMAEFNGSSNGWSDASTPDTGNWLVSPNNKYWMNKGRDFVRGGYYYYVDEGWEMTTNEYIYSGEESDLDYQVSLQRKGCPYTSYGLSIHTDFMNGESSRGYTTANIKSGYAFYITMNGSFSIWRYSGGSAAPLQLWVNSKAIKKGAVFNKLRVVSKGSKLGFFINDIPVWIGTDAFFHAGKTGVVMYSVFSADELNIDWARVYSAPERIGLPDMGGSAFAASLEGDLDILSVEPQQLKLNAAANAARIDEQRPEYAPGYSPKQPDY